VVGVIGVFASILLTLLIDRVIITMLISCPLPLDIDLHVIFIPASSGVIQLVVKETQSCFSE
jgi:hypothetical protein